MVCLIGPQGEDKAGSRQKERQDGLRPDWSIQTKKNGRVWSSAWGFYLKNSIRRRPWEAWETVEEVLSVTHICLWLRGLLSRPSTCTRKPVMV